MSFAIKPQPEPEGWQDLLDRSMEQAVTGKTVAVLPVLEKLWAAAEHIERELGVETDGPTQES